MALETACPWEFFFAASSLIHKAKRHLPKTLTTGFAGCDMLCLPCNECAPVRPQVMPLNDLCEQRRLTKTGTNDGNGTHTSKAPFKEDGSMIEVHARSSCTAQSCNRIPQGMAMLCYLMALPILQLARNTKENRSDMHKVRRQTENEF